jgi:hypothetical protein
LLPSTNFGGSKQEQMNETSSADQVNWSTMVDHEQTHSDDIGGINSVNMYLIATGISLAIIFLVVVAYQRNRSHKWKYMSLDGHDFLTLSWSY